MVATNHILRSLVCAITALSFCGCQKTLSQAGLASFGTPSLYVMNDSSIRLFSYLHGSPEFLTELKPTGDTLTVPQTILVPTLDFGVPENPLLYVNRSAAKTPVPVDLFLKVYSPSSTSPDYYFEVPVLGAALTPTNVTTALSWILRWGTGGATVSLSKNQFDALTAKVEAACLSCRTRSNTELVQWILGDSFLSAALLAELQLSNPALAVTALNYLPPALDYAWSEPKISKDWKILASLSEPKRDLTTQPFGTTRLTVDAVMISPQESRGRVRPTAWAHTATLDEEPDLLVTLGTVTDTPLIFDFDFVSSGLHLFQSQFSGGLSSPLQVSATVLDANASSLCLTTGVLGGRANRVLQANLDKTIHPVATDSGHAAINRLTLSNVSVTDLTTLPPIASATRYLITFHSLVSGGFTYEITRRALTDAGPSPVVGAIPYVNGQPLHFAGFTLFVSGTPLDGDQIQFDVPFTAPSQGGSKLLVDGLGCLDPDPSNQIPLYYTKISGPEGLTIASNGSLSWMPVTTDFLPADPNHLTPFVFGVQDQSGETQMFTAQLKVTEDHLPALCLIASVDGSLHACGVGTLPAGLPVSPAQYKETQITHENFAVSDLDGDPVRLVARAVTATGSLNLVADANTKLNTFTRTIVNWTGLDATLPGLFDFQWQFTPHALQVSGTPTGILSIAFDVSYDTSLDSTLNGDVIATYTIPVTITNIVDAPPMSASTVATCGVTTCNGTNQASFIPTYFVINDATPNGNLVNPRNNANINVGGLAVTNPLMEGETATIQVPVIGQTLDPSVPNLYSITGQSSTCPFLKNGRVKITPSICTGSASATPDCLTIAMNYDTATGTQSVLPSYSPLTCSFALFAHNGLYPSARTSLGTYNIYIQDVNIPPALRASPPTALENVAAGAGYPVEGVPYNLKPFLDTVFSDTDLGATNGQNPTLPTTQLLTVADGASTTFTLQNFDAATWAPELKVAVTAMPSGGTMAFQESADGTTWNAIAGAVKREETSGVVVELVSNSFVGTVAFQKYNTGTSTWINLGATSVVKIPSGTTGATLTNALATSTTVGGRYYVAMDSSTSFRVHVTAFTSGSLAGTMIGDYNLAGSGTALNQDLFMMGAMASSTPSNYATERKINSSSGLANGNYTIAVNAAATRIRAVYTAPTAPAVGVALPTVTVSNSYNVDPREITYAWQCWIVSNPGTGSESFTSCTSSSAVARDTDGNQFFSPAWPSDLSVDSLYWTPPYSVAVDGNLSTNAQRTPSATLLIRLVDKGYYPSFTLLPTDTCNTAGNYYSCVDYRFPLTVLENPAKPTVTLLDAIGNAVTGAKWREQNPTNTAVVPTFTVNEGSSVSFSMSLSSYSSHAADIFPFGIQQIDCKVNGVDCPHRTTGSMLTEPDTLSGDFSSTAPVGGPLLYKFTVRPNSYEGNGAAFADSQTYSYRYRIGRFNTDGTFLASSLQTVGFNIKVANINQSPSALALANLAPDFSSAYTCRSGDSICGLDTAGFLATVDRSTSPSTSLIAIPLQVIDPDVNAAGQPADNLQVSIDTSTGFKNSKVSIINTVVSGQPYAYLSVSLTNSACAPGNTQSTLTIPLIGTDNRKSTTTVKRTLSVTMKKVNATSCLN